MVVYVQNHNILTSCWQKNYLYVCVYNTIIAQSYSGVLPVLQGHETQALGGTVKDLLGLPTCSAM